MADVVSKEKRSQMMAGIKGKDTRPEIIIRKELHSLGYRYRLHQKDLPGKPDLVFPKYKSVIFIHGCFWHKHDCHLFKMPSTRTEFWERKIESNTIRDERHKEMLLAKGWKILIIWECALKGKMKKTLPDVIRITSHFLKNTVSYLEISGNEKPCPDFLNISPG